MNDHTPKPTRPVWYEAHPVSLARKAELRAKGYTVRDAVFTPDGHTNPAEDTPGEGDASRKGTLPQLRAALTERQISFPESAKRADLQALLDATTTAA